MFWPTTSPFTAATKKESRMTRGWLIGFYWTMAVVAITLVASPVEAKSPKTKRCCVTYRHTTVTQTVTKTNCENGQCGATQLPQMMISETVRSTPQKNWYEAALAEARSGGPATHFYSAAQIARMAGRPGSRVFVGVGYNGRTCMSRKGNLVAEVRHGRKTVRIWVY